MLGEHRPTLSDTLWDSAYASLLKPGSFYRETIDEDEIERLEAYFKAAKTQEEIVARAKAILKKYSDQQGGSEAVRKVSDREEQIFLETLFAFHPTKQLPEGQNYPILVGQCHGQPAFLV